MVNSVTIFFNDQKWLEREPCFDFRVDGQILPCGSVVAGFMVWDRGEIKELLYPPSMNGVREENWKQTIEEARKLIRGESC